MLHIRNALPLPQTEENRHEDELRLAREISQGAQFKNVTGVAVRYSLDEQRAYVVANVLSTTNWRPVAEQKLQLPVTMPFDREARGWREAPLILEVLQKLPITPDLILVMGHGIAHPRKFGLACHVGYALDHPTIGVEGLWPLGCRDIPVIVQGRRGDKTALLHETSGARLGYQVYMQDNEEPVFVSPGHRVSVDAAASFALRCTPWHRTPEPLRQAHEAAGIFCRETEA